MRIRIKTAAYAVAWAMGTVLFTSNAQAGTHGLSDLCLPQDQDDASAAKAELKPEVAALIKQSTAIYAAMKSYKHVSEYIIKGQGQDGEINRTLTYTLALDRPNKFCYKSDEANGSAAVSNGKTFINHRNDNTVNEHEHSYYTRISAPVSYKGINIVDDVTFTYGTYMVALMLQGDVLADKEVRAALEQATLKAGTTDNGKKYDLLSIPFQGRPVLFYFDATTHLLHKTVDSVEGNPRQTGLKITEIIENVQIDKPIPASIFEYTPPKNSRLIVSLPTRTSAQIAWIRETRRSRLPEKTTGRPPIGSIGRSF